MESESRCLYRSDFVHDLNIQKEFLNASLHLNAFTNLLHIFLIGILLWFFCMTLFVLDAVREFSNGFIFLTVLYLIIEGIRMLSHIGGGLHFKRTLLTNGGKPVSCSVQFFDNQILSLNTDTDSKSILTYDQVRGIFETKNLILLSMKYRLFLIVDKRALSGNCEAFRQFLLEHCTKCRKKKIRSIRAGQIINRLKWIIVLVLFLLAIALHPAMQLKERMAGQMHNGMSVQEMLSELEGFGITCNDPEALENMYGDTFFLYGNRLESILHHLGTGEYDYDANTFIPSENGVYFVYLWTDTPDTMYTDFLEGVMASSRNVFLMDSILETCSDSGNTTVTFDYDGSTYYLEAKNNDGMFDVQFFCKLNDILLEHSGMQLYFSDYEGFGYFVFFRDEQWAIRFTERTGLKLTAEPLALY